MRMGGQILSNKVFTYNVWFKIIRLASAVQMALNIKADKACLDAPGNPYKTGRPAIFSTRTPMVRCISVDWRATLVPERSLGNAEELP